MPSTYLIFGLDGTISEPVEGIAGAINYALERCGRRRLAVAVGQGGRAIWQMGPPAPSRQLGILG